eukprot:101549-Amorphochlora_amoeboformis.AAC.1
MPNRKSAIESGVAELVSEISASLSVCFPMPVTTKSDIDTWSLHTQKHILERNSERKKKEIGRRKRGERENKDKRRRETRRIPDPGVFAATRECVES